MDIILRSTVEGNVRKKRNGWTSRLLMGRELNVKKINCEQKQSIKSLNTNKQIALN
jgi:hypothetical protein